MNYLKLTVLLFAVACQATGAKKKDDAAPAKDGGIVWTKRAYPTGNEPTSALLFERGMPAEVQSGQRYEYEIRVTNLTDMVLTNVVVTDTAPGGFQVPEGSPAAEVTGELATWKVGELEAKATTSLRASALAGSPGSYRHTARVTYDAPLAGTTTIVQPKLELERTVPDMAIQTDGVTVTYIVRNAGTGTAREVVVEEKLPTGFTTADGTDTVRIEVGSLGAGESRTVSRQIKATSPGAFESAATASAFGGLTAETEKKIVRVTMPALRATVQGPARAAIGQVYTLTLTVGNDGDGPARDTVAFVSLPPNATFVETDGDAAAIQVVEGRLTWNAGTIEPGIESKLNVRMRAEVAAAVEFAGAASAHGAETIDLKAAVEQYGIATVDIEVKDEVDPLQTGSQAVYVVTVRNQGTAAATNIKLVCKLEEGMGFVEAGGSSKGNAADGQVIFEVVPELAAKATLSWRIVVTGEKAGDARFGVEVTADQLDRPVEASESTRFFE
ncbi:MAG: hypothetical protein ACYTHK_17695 [Planctomycetota bacterium]|jgi:uncharacterized repeat protein (TIGR01451 family)